MLALNDYNAAARAGADWRLRCDPGLAWYCSHATLSPHKESGIGMLLLRRWPGGRRPRPDFPQTVGYAARPATVVSEGPGLTPSDGIFWYEPWVVSGGGQVQRARLDQVRPMARASGAYAGDLPNPVSGLRVQAIGDGYAELTWMYNPVGEQAAPVEFDIFTDAGTGTMVWTPPLDKVYYAAGVYRYGYKAGPYADGTWVWFTALSLSDADVYSLVPEPVLGAGGYDRTGFTNPAAFAVGVQITDAARATPPPPAF